MPPILELKRYHQTLSRCLGQRSHQYTLNKGEILALLGENGAGKTTLMNILYGLYKPDEGEILINGEKIELNLLLTRYGQVSEWSTSTSCSFRCSL